MTFIPSSLAVLEGGRSICHWSLECLGQSVETNKEVTDCWSTIFSPTNSYSLHKEPVGCISQPPPPPTPCPSTSQIQCLAHIAKQITTVGGGGGGAALLLIMSSSYLSFCSTLLLSKTVFRLWFLIYIIIDHFYIALFSALKQTHCTHMWFYMSE